MTKASVSSIIVATAVFIAGVTTEAQQPKKIPLMGYLTRRTDRDSLNAEALRQGLKGLAYVEGQNIAIEFRSAEGYADRLPGLAAELVRLKVASFSPPAPRQDVRPRMQLARFQ